ncbi:hypothetical protein O0L34_g11751 [Tuta absoluta]|nr:hypothetical protein O0L34_g11751 [Tuta absoluta]
MHLSCILVFTIVFYTPYGECRVGNTLKLAKRTLNGESNITRNNSKDEGKSVISPKDGDSNSLPSLKDPEQVDKKTDDADDHVEKGDGSIKNLKEDLNETGVNDRFNKLYKKKPHELEEEDGIYDEGENDETKEQSYQKYYNEKIGQMSEAMGNNWPLGIIPYKVDASSYDGVLASRVRDAMDFLESVSCLQFKLLSENSEGNFAWIHITNPEGQRECSHKPKRKKSGEIVLILGLECLKKREILHSLLHGIGFGDEVTHHQRDQYIRIMWENIQPKYQHLFASSPGEKKIMVEYDPMSIMHFHDRAFSKNGQATIVPLMPGLQIQPSEKLSQLDKMKLRLAFGHECNRRTVDKLFDTCKSVMRQQSDERVYDNEADDDQEANDDGNAHDDLKADDTKNILLGQHDSPPKGNEKVNVDFSHSKERELPSSEMPL